MAQGNDSVRLIEELARSAGSSDPLQQLAQLLNDEAADDGRVAILFEVLGNRFNTAATKRLLYFNEFKKFMSDPEMKNGLKLLERVQSDDIDKITVLRLMHRQTQTKIDDKVNFGLKLKNFSVENKHADDGNVEN
ncbi:hypothetical protein OROHE_026597 [Orobanche hederae]